MSLSHALQCGVPSGWASNRVPRRVVQPTNLNRAEPFITADGSSIREVAGPVSQPTRNQSLAEATVPPGGETAEHYHRVAEELYFFTAGAGRMRLGDAELEVAEGDCVVIAPGTPHKLWNPGGEPLVLLCCCAPAYSDEDTVLTGG
jgi:mannose-6-phosphate isomerase-like protein (cupin superfamily)